ncbi:hypothetical protein VTO42DRAFT_4519 [Malbranchea cinnamomea]
MFNERSDLSGQRLPLHGMRADSTFPIGVGVTFLFYISVGLLSSITLFVSTGLANPIQKTEARPWLFHDSQQIPLDIEPQQSGPPITNVPSQRDDQQPLVGEPDGIKDTLKTILDALDVMQSEYFVLWQGTWPTGNDWTRAVMATQVSATLSAVSWRLDDILSVSKVANDSVGSKPFDALAYENLLDYYFQHTSAFWFGENYIGLRFQAYDDMLWVVLEWLENLKFQELHSELHFSSYANESLRSEWHGKHYGALAAHRARVFYELASQGWDETLCGGGMIWNPYLLPYKNAITNELFISASVGMYLYFPGDTIEVPFAGKRYGAASNPGNPDFLNAAVIAYDWLRNSNMRGINNLYADGFHIRGWREDDPGTGNCDVLNPMVYTYNQGVILSGLRGLWLATGLFLYLKDGHELVGNVMKSTGWPNISSQEWRGLGRGGVLEEICDSSGRCSQNSHTFKGIFFHHFIEFCRPLTPYEERFLSASLPEEELVERKRTFKWHQQKCSTYRHWIEHNAHAAYVTMNEEGKFGMWWGRKYPDYGSSSAELTSSMPGGAIDYQNSVPTVHNISRADQGSPQLDDKPRLTKRPRLFRGGGHLVEFQDEQPSGETADASEVHETKQPRDVNDRGRGRTVETQAGALAVFRALYYWQTSPSLADGPA